MKYGYIMRNEDGGAFSLHQNAWIIYASILKACAFFFPVLSRTVPKVLPEQKALWGQSFWAEVKQL